ncbi:sensor histidine kinase [Nesterenkonia alba]|uniref:sensor histidine kinase n=1 Tax=Nesterenkonia alba TaxID=515814 RepID=UPI0003B46AA2|nr:sensor histidine kinase [Nesterenkonia alba]
MSTTTPHSTEAEPPDASDAGGTPGDAEPTTRTQHIAGFLYAGVWIVFLAVPVIAIYYSQAAIGWRVLAGISVVLFAVLYLWSAWRWFTEEPTSAPSWSHLWASQLVLGLIAAVSMPAIGPWVVAFTPYLAALIIYTRSPRVGIPIGVLIWAVPSLLALIWADFDPLWIAAGPGIGMGFIVAMRLTEYYEDRDRRRAETLRAAEDRDRIARDVHDVLGHSLTVLSIKAQLARRLMEAEPDRARAELDDIERISRESLTQVRSTVSRLKAPQLPGELDVARSTLASAGIQAEIHRELGDTDRDSHRLLAWVLREAVTNVVRHSEASRCAITVTPNRLQVADDGLGLGTSREGNGLRGVRERAQRNGARVVLGRAFPELEGTSAERPGTRVEVALS